MEYEEYSDEEISKPGKVTEVLASLRDEQEAFEIKGGKAARHSMLLAYQIAFIARNDEDTWLEICGDPRWDNFRRRPKQHDRPDALRYVVRLSVGFHGVPANQIASTRYRAMSPSFERRTPVMDLKALLDTHGGAENLIAWERSANPSERPRSKQTTELVLLRLTGKNARKLRNGAELQYSCGLKISARKGRVVDAKLVQLRPHLLLPSRTEKSTL